MSDAFRIERDDFRGRFGFDSATQSVRFSEMSYVTVEVEIDHGRIVVREPEKLPAQGSGLLTILQPGTDETNGTKTLRERVELPLIRGDGKRIINPTPEQLDASLWGD